MTSVVAFFFVLLISGCATLSSSPAHAPSKNGAPTGTTEAVAPAIAPPPRHDASRPIAPTPAEVSPVAPASSSAAASPPPSARSTGKETAPPNSKAPARPSAPAVPPAPPSTRKGSTPDAAPAKAPPLDLASLEQRLKDTKAIGVLTKVTLKNQVDDLLDQFRAFHQGTRKSSLAELRRAYDLLVLKVLSLLQDSDQPLASALAGSREAIWGMLSDPAKFATI